MLILFVLISHRSHSEHKRKHSQTYNAHAHTHTLAAQQSEFYAEYGQIIEHKRLIKYRCRNAYNNLFVEWNFERFSLKIQFQAKLFPSRVYIVLRLCCALYTNSLHISIVIFFVSSYAADYPISTIVSKND